MSFTAWDEASPADGDPAGSLGTYIRSFKLQVRERLATVFGDWSSATDRITTKKIFVDGTNGLLIKKSDDTTTFGEITKDGYSYFNLPANCSIVAGSSHVVAGPSGMIKFQPTSLTELYDSLAMHNSGVSPWKVTIPTGFDGLYKLTAGFSFTQTTGFASQGSYFRFSKGGAGTGPVFYFYHPGMSNNISVMFSYHVALVATNYVEPYYNISTTGNVTVSDHYFSIERLSQ
jgi:hypothetical protein